MIKEHYGHELTGEVDDEGYIGYALRRWLNVKSPRSVLFVRRRKTTTGPTYCLVLYESGCAAKLYQKFARDIEYLTPSSFFREVGNNILT
jgi:hypothetical protein